MKPWLLSLLLLPALLLAAPDKPTPVTIEADRMELDQKRGTSVYTGNVVLVQGGLEIKAERITLYSVKKKLQRAVAKGSPATLVQQGESEENTIKAEAATMEYQPQSGEVQLSGKAQLWRGGSAFSGEQISYDLERQMVKASGSEEGQGRVKVLLQPEGDETAEKAQ